MKKTIYILLAVMLLVCGCEYHPYYDGQKFRIYNRNCGLIEEDGCHLYVPIVDTRDYTITIYGGKGKKHLITVDDPQYLGYTYEEANVEATLWGEGIVPATITIEPKEIGETSMRILDEDTGESIQVYLHVVKSYSMLVIKWSENSLEEGLVLAFEFLSNGDVVKICRKDPETGRIEYMMDAKFRFLDYKQTVALELTYKADAEGQPDVDGVETVKLFRVQEEDGQESYSWQMLQWMNLNYLPVTRGYYKEPDYQYYMTFRFVDITDGDISEQDPYNLKCFYAESAYLDTIGE